MSLFVLASATYSWLAVAWHVIGVLAVAVIAGAFVVIAVTENRDGNVLGVRAMLALLAARARHLNVPGRESPAPSATECGTGTGAPAGHPELSERLATTGEQRAVREPVIVPVAAALKDGTGDDGLPPALQEPPAEALTEPLFPDDTRWQQYAGLAELLAKQEVSR